MSQIHKVKSKNIREYLHQFAMLVLKKGVLNQVYEYDGSTYHQLVLPAEYMTTFYNCFMMNMIINNQGR